MFSCFVICVLICTVNWEVGANLCQVYISFCPLGIYICSGGRRQVIKKSVTCQVATLFSAMNRSTTGWRLGLAFWQSGPWWLHSWVGFWAETWRRWENELCEMGDHLIEQALRQGCARQFWALERGQHGWHWVSQGKLWEMRTESYPGDGGLLGSQIM